MNLQPVSIILEAMVVLTGLMLAVKKKKSYGWCIALTFGIYIYYDLANYLALGVSKGVLSVLFFIASVSILWAVTEIYRKA
jgi:hypothetical protein